MKNSTCPTCEDRDLGPTMCERHVEVSVVDEMLSHRSARPLGSEITTTIVDEQGNVRRRCPECETFTRPSTLTAVPTCGLCTTPYDAASL
jgi:hypothetical protein